MLLRVLRGLVGLTADPHVAGRALSKWLRRHGLDASDHSHAEDDHGYGHGGVGASLRIVWSESAKSIAAALFYGFCSIAMNFLNKAVVSSYEFNYPFFIMVCQMLVTVILLDGLRLSGRLSSSQLSAYTAREGLLFLPASLCFALHSTLSLSALHGMNIPMYGAIKRCTPLVNLALGVLILKKALPSRSICVSIGLITVGVLVASAGDLEFDQSAYLMGTLSVFAQGGYLTLVQRCSEISKRSTLEMIYINGWNTLPVFALLSVITREPADIRSAHFQLDSGFALTFVALIIFGSILTYSQFLCAAVCSALTASLVGVGKSVIQTFIGFFTFGGVKFSIINILGLALNLLGGCLYTYVKYEESKQRGLRRASCVSSSTRPLLEDAEATSDADSALLANGHVAAKDRPAARSVHIHLENENNSSSHQL